MLACVCLLILAPLLSLRDLGRLGPMSRWARRQLNAAQHWHFQKMPPVLLQHAARAPCKQAVRLQPMPLDPPPPPLTRPRRRAVCSAGVAIAGGFAASVVGVTAIAIFKGQVGGGCTAAVPSLPRSGARAAQLGKGGAACPRVHDACRRSSQRGPA